MKNSKYIIIGLLLIVTIFIIYFIICSFNGETLELTYTLNAGTSYEYEVYIDDENVVKLDRSYVIENKNINGLVGAPVSTNYVFKGYKRGSSKVVFKLVNTTDGKVEKEEEHILKVDYFKNVSEVVVTIN